MVGFAAQTSNQPRHNDQSWRIDVATGIVQGSSFKREGQRRVGNAQGGPWFVVA